MGIKITTRSDVRGPGAAGLWDCGTSTEVRFCELECVVAVELGYAVDAGACTSQFLGTHRAAMRSGSGWGAGKEGWRGEHM